MPDLFTLTRTQGANRALISREVEPAGWRLAFADEPVLVRGFRRMVRDLEYDVAELAVTTYLTAKEHGARFTALPVFLVRDFHHGKTQVRNDGTITHPSDLAGRRVGVSRGYTVTAGVWARAALADDGLDLSSVTWVLSGDEHVASYVPPSNVVSAPAGQTLEELLLNGDVDAVINADIQGDCVTTLLPEDAASRSLRATGYVPVNHLVVVRDELVDANPELPVALFEAFAEAKRRYVDTLREGASDSPQDRTLAMAMTATDGADPLPYGVEPNREVLGTLIDHAIEQEILTRRPEIDTLFAPGTVGLAG